MEAEEGTGSDLGLILSNKKSFVEEVKVARNSGKDNHIIARILNVKENKS